LGLFPVLEFGFLRQAVFFCLLFFTLHICDGKGKTYKRGDNVQVLVNTVGPYRNPQERYKYLKKLPFCHSEGKNKKQAGGSAFAGDRAEISDYSVSFTESVQDAELCTVKLDEKNINKFYKAIMEDFTFDFFVDDLIVDGFVGEKEQGSAFFSDHDDTAVYLFTHFTFHIEYNDNKIIACHLQPDRFKKVELKKETPQEIKFGYSVSWESVTVSHKERLRYHQRNQIRAQQVEIHWLAIVNSFVLVILLVAFLVIIVTRILKKDYARYGTDPDELTEFEDLDDSGWKQVHGDVFRPPKSIMIFSSMVGTGTQLLVLTFGVLLLSLVGIFYPGKRGALTIAIIILYCFTAGIAGHVSGKLYTQMGGKDWLKNAILTAMMFVAPFSFVFCVVNTIAMVYKSTAALPIVHILGAITLWLCVALTLTLWTASKVKDVTAKLDVPCKTNIAHREIPPTSWYRHWSFQIIFAGILPFTAIYIELHYVFNAVFGHRVYTLFGILSLAFLLLVIVASSITVTLTYFQLTIEDHYWWWRSFLSAGSTGFYIFGYAIFFWVYRSNMQGPLQFTLFFGYLAVVSYAFFLMLGAVGFFSSFIFVKHIYAAIKLD